MQWSDNEEWWLSRDNLLLLLTAMAADPAYDKDDLVYAVEKPWKYRDEFVTAMLQVDRMRVPGQPHGQLIHGRHIKWTRSRPSCFEGLWLGVNTNGPVVADLTDWTDGEVQVWDVNHNAYTFHWADECPYSK